MGNARRQKEERRKKRKAREDKIEQETLFEEIFEIFDRPGVPDRYGEYACPEPGEAEAISREAGDGVEVGDGAEADVLRPAPEGHRGRGPGAAAPPEEAQVERVEEGVGYGARAPELGRRRLPG